MQVYKVGDTVVHWSYGSGQVTAIEAKGLLGESELYYVIESRGQTLWIPVDESGSLHLPTSRADFQLLIDILRSPGEKIMNNSHQRQVHLNQRLHFATPQEVCLVIRDLSSRARRRPLNGTDKRILNRAKTYLLSEWQQTFGISRLEARQEMERI